MGKHGGLYPRGDSRGEASGLYGLLGEGLEWSVLTCDKCGFIAICQGDKIVPVSSPEELERFREELEALGDAYYKRIEKVKRPICARYDKAVEKLVSKMFQPQLTIHPEKRYKPDGEISSPSNTNGNGTGATI